MTITPIRVFTRMDTSRIWELLNELGERLNQAIAAVNSPPDTGWTAHGGTLAASVVEIDPIQYRIVQGVVYWRGRVRPSSAWTSGSINNVLTNLPAAVRPALAGVLACSVDSGSGAARVHSDGTFVFTPNGSTTSWPQFGGGYPLG